MMSAAKGPGYQRNKDPVVQLSRRLSYYLRHGAQKHKLNMREDGSVAVSELVLVAIILSSSIKLGLPLTLWILTMQLKLPELRNVTLDQIKHVVVTNDKKRFTLFSEPAPAGLEGPSDPSLHQTWYIRANQGHSIEIKALPLRPITDPCEFPNIVHGTNFKAWKSIKSQGLKTMGRNHIHFAPGILGEEGVVSGMRVGCTVFIYIDAEAAMK
ncbi:tRNA 2'-phosphotransferase, partial [Spiromyces aspiralis]